MKKIAIALSLLLLTLTMLVSCFGNKLMDPPSDDPTDGETVSATVWSKDFDTVIVTKETTKEILSLQQHIYNLTGRSPQIVAPGESTADHRIVIGQTDEAVSKNGYSKLDRYADLFSISKDGKSAYYLYAENGSLCVAYSDSLARKQALDYILENIEAESFTPDGDTVNKVIFDTLDYIEAVRLAEQEMDFGKTGSVIGQDNVAALKRLYTLFSDSLYVWVANLYDPDNGGFYYSASARDNVGFLPDLESTAQALAMLENSGLADYYGGKWPNMIPSDISAKILAYAKSLQASDGYFYHPQWGASISASRRGRDAGWGRRIITDMGAEPNYPYVTDIATAVSSSGLPSRLGIGSVSAVSMVIPTASDDVIYASEQAFIDYLDSLNLHENSYSAGNLLNSTSGMITAKGYKETLKRYLTEHQNPENGLWEDEVTYQSVNGLMKLSSFFGKSFPNAEKAMDSAIEILMLPIDDELTGITFVYNPWVAISNLLGAVSNSKKAELRSMLYSKASEIFKSTAEKLGAFSKADGGFSYLRDYSSPFSQDALVAVSGSAESDVNATTIAISTVVKYMKNVFDADFPKVYGSTDTIYFLDTLKSMKSVIKSTLTVEDPEVITFDDFDPEEGQVSGNMVLNPHPDIIVNMGDATTKNDNYVFVESAIVPNPKKEADTKDLVYYFGDKVNSEAAEGELKIAETASSQEFKITNIGAAGNCYIFEADMLFGGLGNPSDPAVQLTFVRSGSALISAWVDIYQYTRFGKNYLRINDYFAGADGVKDSETVAGIPVDDWFKLRVEMYKDYSGEGGSLMTRLKFFVNGEYVGTSDSGHYEKGAYKDFLVSGVKLSYYRHSASSFYLNDVYVAKSGAVYRDESVPAFESNTVSANKTVWDFQNGIPREDKNFTEMFYEDEGFGYTSIDPNDWDQTLEDLYGKSHGTKISSVPDPLDPNNMVLKAYSQNSKKAQYKATMYTKETLLAENGSTYEIEFDYYFERINWVYSETLFSVNLHNKSGSPLATVSFVAKDFSASHNTRNLGIKIGSELVDDFSIISNRWYSFRMVYHFDAQNPADSRMLVYILDEGGEYVCIANELLPTKRSTISGVSLGFHCYDIRATQYIDDLSVLRTDRAYTPTTPTPGDDVEIPKPEDTNIYVEESSRGEGKYSEDSIRYSVTTIEDLIKSGLMANNTARGDGVSAGKRKLSIGGSNPALIYESLGSGNHAINFVSKFKAYEGFIFETDLMLDGVDTEEGRDIRFTGTKSNGLADAAIYRFNVKIFKNHDEKKGGYVVMIDGSESTVVIPDKTWVNIRLEAEGVKKGSALKFYVNNNLLIETSLSESIEGIAGVELFTPSTYGGHGWETGKINLDNTYVSGYGKAPEQIAVEGASRGEGAYKNNSISFTGATYDKIINDGLMAENIHRTNGVAAGNRTVSLRNIDNNAALVYGALQSGIHSLNFTSQSDAIDGFIFETDLKLRGVNATSGRDIRFTGTVSNGTKDAGLWALNIKICANSDTTVGGYVLTVAGSEKQFLIKDNVWTNIRLVVEGVDKGSKASLYLNGKLAETFNLTASIAGIKGMELYTPSTYNGAQGWTSGTVSIDNIYVSGTGIYVPPPVIEEESRGEGLNKDNSLSYSDTDYSALTESGKLIASAKRGDGISVGARTVSFKDIGGDRAFVYTALASGNHAINFKSDTAASLGFVFETDLMLEGVDVESGRDIRFTGTNSNGSNDSNLWAFNLRLCVNPDTKVGGYLVSLSGTNQTLVIKDGSWVNIRLEAEGTAKGDALKLYVNGELRITSVLTESISGIKGIELFTPSTYNGQHGWEKGSIYLDNTYVHGIPLSEDDKPELGGEDIEEGNNGENIDKNGWVKVN